MVIFPAGTYVVFLSYDGKEIKYEKYNNIPTSYCYQLRVDSTDTSIHMSLDMGGSVSNGYNNNCPIELRLATPREEAEYKRRGKPYDVRELPVDPIINNYPIF